MSAINSSNNSILPSNGNGRSLPTNLNSASILKLKRSSSEPIQSRESREFMLFAEAVTLGENVRISKRPKRLTIL